jgi:hypothetical protein
MKVYFHKFLTLALDGGNFHDPAASPSVKEPPVPIV